MNRPTIDPNAPPLEILPWGRTLEDEQRLAAKKAKGRRGWHGCLLQLVALALAFVFMAGYLSGASQPFIKESSVDR